MINDPRTITIEKRLGLPGREEERVLFQRFDLYDLLDRYGILADFLIDDYACPNRNMSIIVDEVVHNVLLRGLIRFRSKRGELDIVSFPTFYTMLVREVMEDYVNDGMVYRLSATKVAP